MKRTVGLVAGLLLLSASVLAQDNYTGWTCPEGFAGQTLNVYNWSSYIADDTVANFEAACGVKVNYDTYISNEDLLAKLQLGNPGYDVIYPTGYMVEIMIGEGLLEPLDYSQLPNFQYIAEDLTDPPYDPGSVYSVPYQWGTVGIAYNVTRTGFDPTSWEDMFNYPGRVAWLEDPRAMLSIALLKLGYDPNSEDAGEIAQARDYLIANGRNVTNIVMADSKTLLQNGDIDMAVDYPGNTFQLQALCECDDFRYVIPEEGTNIWTDTVAIPVGGQNKALALVWVNYMLDPQVNAAISNYVVYATPNEKALELGLINDIDNPAIYPPPDIRARLFFTAANPDSQQLYNDAWDEIRVALAR